MKNKRFRLTPLVVATAIACALAACARKDEPEPAQPEAPQTAAGAVLQAAKNAADKANERNRELEKEAQKIGE